MNYLKYPGGLEASARLLSECESKIYHTIGDLSVEAWKTKEPLAFGDRVQGSYRKIAPSERWAEDRFDCAWMRFSYAGPRSVERCFIRIDVNGELCLVEADGLPVRGLTCIKSSFDPAFGAPGKTIYEVPASCWSEDGTLEIWASAGYNDLFGTPVGEGRLEFAELCTRDEAWRNAYYDLEVVVDYFSGISDEDEYKKTYLNFLNRWMESGLGDNPQSLQASLKEILRINIPRASLEVSTLGHAHLDLAWLWPVRESYRKGARTFASALYNFERYPEYIFGCSQPQLFQWMKDQYPDLYLKIKKAVNDGKIELLGTFWVEPDCNLVNGESLVRQILYGRKFFLDEFGIAPDFCWQPDVFGYNGQLPQILRRSGHSYFMTQKLSWNVVNPFPYQSFVWEGIDGSEILVHMLPEETYNGPAAPRAVRKIMDEYREREVSHHALMVYGIGDGGGGPDAEHLERLRRVNDLPGFPRVRQEPAAEFFKKWATEAVHFPRWQGELYLERHQGTFTTQGQTKRYNRQCETKLREAEWSGLLAQRYAQRPYPAERLKEIWDKVLLFQFHDILPGSSIERVYDEAYPEYAALIAELDEMIASAYTAVARSAGSTLVFNSHPWERQDWIQVCGDWRKVNVPPMGWCRWPNQAEALTDPFRVDLRCLENERLRAEFGEDGCLISLYDNEASRELIATGHAANTFVVFADRGDAWDFETDHVNRDPWVYLRQKPLKPSLVGVESTIDGPWAILTQRYKLNQSSWTVRISLAADARELRFAVKLDWREKGSMLRVRFPTAIEADQARYEIPFGSIERSTGDIQARERAELEVPALQWALLAEEEYGVALLNDCKHGHRIKGSVIDLNLLRSVPHPEGAKVTPSGRAEAIISDVYTDIGPHEFSYALMPLSRPVDLGEVTKAARFFNTPLVVAGDESNSDGATTLPCMSLIQVDQEVIEITAVKPAEDGAGVIVRMCNVERSGVDAAICFEGSVESVWECDLVERPEREETLVSAGVIQARFRPFEVKTFRCVFRAED